MNKDLILAILAELSKDKDDAPGPVKIPTYGPFEVGKSYFIRTVTYHAVGCVVAVSGKWVELRSAAWVADSGRFMQAIRDGALSEVEPVGHQWINADTIVDVFPWLHALPETQK